MSPRKKKGSSKQSKSKQSKSKQPKHQAVVPTQQLRARTAEDIANEQTAEQLALRIWAAMVGTKVLKDMSALMDELLQSHLVDDDDEESDEGWLDDQHKKEKKQFDEAIAAGLDKYPSIAAVRFLPINFDPKIVLAAEQLRAVLEVCPIGATKFSDRFPRAQLERMVRRDVMDRLKNDPKYSEHVCGDVPGTDIKTYGSRGRTSSKGTFTKALDFEAGGWLDTLLTGGWMRVAKDRIDPMAWSHQYGLQRKTQRQSWRHHFTITERNGHQSPFELPREKLAGTGASAIRLLTKAGVHVVGRQGAQKALAQFLRFKPKHEIVRMARVGWAQINERWIFVRPDQVITPANMPQATHTTYLLDATATLHGLHVAGTAEGWAAEIAAPFEGDSNVALAFGTFFAAPLLEFAGEPGGGFHIFGRSTIGKTMASAAGQSVYGQPHETADDTFGVSWGGTEAGFDALAPARTDLGLPVDEITLANRHTAEQVVYKVASGTKGPRATSVGHLRETAHASLLVFSTGEKSLVQFIPDLQEGARKRLVDVPAEVQPGSAFETITHDQIHIEGRRFFGAVKHQHGAVGLAWQRHLIAIGPNQIRADLEQHREALLALPEVAAVTEKAHPQARAVANRFTLLGAALRMAIEAGLLPWSVAQADAGIIACMDRWVAQRGNIDIAGEIVRAARQIETDLAVAMEAGRFVRLHKTSGSWSGPTTEADDMADGYLKGDLVLIRPQVWNRLCAGSEDLARYLCRIGKLIPDNAGKTSRKETVLGKAGRFYVWNTGTPEHVEREQEK
jgi:putative DNA primase/helicase